MAAVGKLHVELSGADVGETLADQIKLYALLAAEMPHEARQAEIQRLTAKIDASHEAQTIRAINESVARA
jgi:hypothetical protein